MCFTAIDFDEGGKHGASHHRRRTGGCGIPDDSRGCRTDQNRCGDRWNGRGSGRRSGRLVQRHSVCGASCRRAALEGPAACRALDRREAGRYLRRELHAGCHLRETLRVAGPDRRRLSVSECLDAGEVADREAPRHGLDLWRGFRRWNDQHSSLRRHKARAAGRGAGERGLPARRIRFSGAPRSD